MLKRGLVILSLFVFTINIGVAQEIPDSSKPLENVTVRAFEQKGNESATAVIKIVSPLRFDNSVSLLPAFNTIAGVRMEERSPGSNRLNIRGSSLRSPFGVRNVKVYWNNMPVTDPGGNTYFNQFAANSFSYAEVFKSPASSMYGAGSGGLLLLNTQFDKPTQLNVEFNAGSFSTKNFLLDGNFTGSNYYTGVSMIHQKGDGYREHTQSEKTSLTWSTNLRLNEKKELSASVLFTDMYYQTPGALTLKEFQENPRAARPKAGTFPSAADAKAAISQKTFLTGFTFRNHLNQSVEHTTTIYGSYAEVKNPAIRNYERRSEPHFGGRTLLTLNKEWNHQKSLKWSSGIEFQQGYFNIMVSKNKGGSPDTLMTNDDVNTMIYSLFTQAVLSVTQSWFLTAGVSYNKSSLEFSRLTSYPVRKQFFSYKNELAPRVSVLKKINDFSILASVSKGFSPPTVAELLPSTGIINTELEAEHGWNYELTAKQSFLKRKLNIEATGFYFNLNNALVLQRDAAGADFFSNAGKIHQKGLELTADYIYLPLGRQIFDYFLINTGYAFSHFRYGNYVKENNDYSGKTVPSIPAHSLSLWSDILLVNGLYFKPSYYYASKIYLNDANTAAANPYHLLGVSVGYKKQFQKLKLKLYAGADNLLDERYSLGNDINASGGRFYNAAPGRNFFAGVAISILKTSTGK